MSYLDLYLKPFFGELSFGDLNATTFDRFIAWARQQQYRKKVVENKTLNEVFMVLKMVCKSAAIEYDWGRKYDPFFGFKKLPEDDAYESIFPFSVSDQGKLIDSMPEHWKPYFRFAFCSGLRPGEQFALKPADIDWSKQVIHVRNAITRGEKGKKVEGDTKNRFSRRSIKRIPAMLEALEEQKKIHERFNGKYFFCTTTGVRIDIDNLRDRVWTPAMKRAELPYREMKQTRRTFATIALTCGENPLWIARVMGHRDTDMIINV